MNTATHHGQNILETWGGGAKQTNKKQNTDKITRTPHDQPTHIKQALQTTTPHKQEDKAKQQQQTQTPTRKNSTIRTTQRDTTQSTTQYTKHT